MNCFVNLSHWVTEGHHHRRQVGLSWREKCSPLVGVPIFQVDIIPSDLHSSDEILPDCGGSRRLRLRSLSGGGADERQQQRQKSRSHRGLISGQLHEQEPGSGGPAAGRLALKAGGEREGSRETGGVCVFRLDDPVETGHLTRAPE